MDEPPCFTLLEKEAALELKRHMMMAMGIGAGPGRPLKPEDIEGLRTRMQEEPFLLEEEDIEDVIA
jgi:hypothetical protein